MIILSFEVYQEGVNLGRLEGFRLIVEALGGKVEAVRATPVFEDHWRLDIPVVMPSENQERCTRIAKRQFDGQVTCTITGSHEGPM